MRRKSIEYQINEQKKHWKLFKEINVFDIVSYFTQTPNLSKTAQKLENKTLSNKNDNLKKKTFICNDSHLE